MALKKTQCGNGSGQHSGHGPSVCFQMKSKFCCTLRWWKGSLGETTLMSRIEPSLTYIWCRRKAISRVSVAGDQSLKVLDKELQPLHCQMFGFRPGRQCLDVVSFLVESLRKAAEKGEKLFVVSMDVASAFDTVRAEILGDALQQRGASNFSATAVVRGNLNLCCRPCMWQSQCELAELQVGSRQGGPRTPSGWNRLVAILVEELLGMWSVRGSAVTWAPLWERN